VKKHDIEEQYLGYTCLFEAALHNLLDFAATPLEGQLGVLDIAFKSFEKHDQKIDSERAEYIALRASDEILPRSINLTANPDWSSGRKDEPNVVHKSL
jgi:hypothetical protein